MSTLVLKAANEFSTVFLGTSRSDDSTGDRINYRYTCAILIAFTVIVSTREFTMKRIQCWIPAFFTDNYEDYTNNVCWVRNTYYVDESDQIPESKDLRQQSSIRYYQWIPFILLFEAFSFFLPYLFWRILCQRSGIDIRDMVEAASDYKNSKDEQGREQLMKFMVSVIDQYVDDPRRQSNNRVTVWWKKCFLVFFPSSGRYMGDYLRNLFLFVKVLYVCNVFGQVLVLAFLLDQPFWSLGYTVLQYLYEGRGWNFHSRYFPKVTLCDFRIREPNSLSTSHTYTVMCVLPINLFNQQIFTFLWFWYVIVIFCTVYDLFIWIHRLFIRREKFLLERLKVLPRRVSKQWPFEGLSKEHILPEGNGDNLTSEHGSLSENQYQDPLLIVPSEYRVSKRTILDFFNHEYLEADGHFILRIISTNASDFVATILLHNLYNLCCSKRFRPDVVQDQPSKSFDIIKRYLSFSDLSDPSTMMSTNNEEARMTVDGSMSASNNDQLLKNQQQRIVDSLIVGSVMTSVPTTDLHMGAQKRVPGSHTTDS